MERGSKVKKVLTALATTGTLFATTACHPWFGTPMATPTVDACATHVVPDVRDHLPNARPAVIPPGWMWQTVRIHVRALDTTMDRDYCVPFAVHLYAKIEGGGPVTFFDGRSEWPTPYDGHYQTPWQGGFFTFAYDPSDPKWKVPPTYEVQVIATYENDRDLFKTPPEAFRCSIEVQDNDFAAQTSTDLVKQKVVSCKLSLNLYQM